MITQLILNALIAGSVYSLAAVGFSMVHLSRRFFDFSLAGSMVLSGYLSLWFGEKTGLGLPMVVLATLLVTAGLNWVLQLFAYRPLRWVGSRPTVMLVASLGLMIVLVNAVSLVFGDAPYRPVSLGWSTNLEALGGRVTSLHILTVGTSLLLGILTSYGIQQSSFGARLRAVANDEVLARAVGMNLGLVEIVGSWLGLLLATEAVVLSGLDFGLTPSLGFQLLIPAVTASVIGGIGSVKGAFVGGFLVGLVQEAIGAVLGVAWENAILFSVLLVFFLVKPTGLWGTRFTPKQT
jgi:branched-chain amino acid transport system permease protein